MNYDEWTISAYAPACLFMLWLLLKDTFMTSQRNYAIFNVIYEIDMVETVPTLRLLITVQVT